MRRPPFAALRPFALAICVGSGVAHVASSTMPFQVGGLIDGQGATPAEAGLFGFLEIGALALTMVLVAPWMSRFAPILIAAVGCGAMLVGNLGIYVAPIPGIHLLFAVVAGAGYGLVFAATIAAAAASSEADRLYALGNGGALLIVVVIMTTLPAVSARLGATGVFASLAVLAVLALPMLIGLGRRSTYDPAQIVGTSAIRLGGAPGLILCWTMLSLGAGGLYAFCERIGHARGLPAQAIANVLSVGAFTGLIGTGATLLFGARIDRRLALIVGLFGTGLSCLLIGYGPSLEAFAVGVGAYWIFYMFLYSYIMGTSALIDPTGRLGTLGGGLERLGYASGVWAAGLISEHFSYYATGVFGCIGCVLAGLGLPSVFRALRERGRAADSTI